MLSCFFLRADEMVVIGSGGAGSRVDLNSSTGVHRLLAESCGIHAESCGLHVDCRSSIADCPHFLKD